MAAAPPDERDVEEEESIVEREDPHFRSACLEVLFFGENFTKIVFFLYRDFLGYFTLTDGFRI